MAQNMKPPEPNAKLDPPPQEVPSVSPPKTGRDHNDSTQEVEGPFASHAENNAHVWKIYADQAKISDEQIFKICKNDLDSLLIFAGLFSAILSAFLIEIRKGLQEDLQGITNALLLSLIELQRNSSAVLTTQAAFVPTLSSQWINGLWFSSLIFSLTSALGASLAKGWIAQYSQASSGTTAQDACSRHHLYVGIRSWHLQTLILALPIPIHVAFFQFFAGLIILLRDDDIIIGNVILSLVAITTSLYVLTTFLPTVRPDCPFQTPISRLIAKTIRSLLPFEEVIPAPPHTKASALAWLLQNSADEGHVKATIKALAGLPTTVKVEQSLHKGGVVDILTREISKYMDRILRSSSTEDKDSLEASLHTTIRLLQSGPPSAKLVLEPLRPLLDSALSSLSEIGRSSHEVAFCAKARLQLFYPVAPSDESLFTTDIPILQKACCQENVKEMLTETSLLLIQRNEDLLRDLRNEEPGIRTSALERLEHATRSELQVDTGIQSRRYREWRLKLESGNEGEQVACITGFRKLLDDEWFRSEIVPSGGILLIQTMLNTGRDSFNLAVLEMMPTVLTHDDIRHELAAPASIGAVVAMMTRSDWGIVVRMAAMRAVSTLAGHKDIQAKIIEANAISTIIKLMEDPERDVREAATGTIAILAGHADIRAQIIKANAILEIIALMENQERDVRKAATGTIAILAGHTDIRAQIIEANAILEIIALMENQEWDVRKAATGTIAILAGHADIRAKIIEANAISTIIKLMEDPEWVVRQAATGTIAILAGHADIRAKIIEANAISTIIKLMEDPKWDVRKAAMDAISSLVDHADIRPKVIEANAISEIIELMEDPEWVVRQAATDTIAILAGHADIRAKIIEANAISKIIALMGNQEQDVCQAAADVISRLAGHADIRAKIIEANAIIALMGNQEQDVRKATADVISRLAGHDDSKASIIESTALSEIIMLLKHHSVHVRDAATRILRQLVDDSFNFQAVAQLLHDQSPDVVLSVLTLILTFKHHKPMRNIFRGDYLLRLAKILKHEYMRHVCIELISALCEYPDMEKVIRASEIIIVLLPLLNSSDERMKSSAEEVLSKLGLIGF